MYGKIQSNYSLPKSSANQRRTIYQYLIFENFYWLSAFCAVLFSEQLNEYDINGINPFATIVDNCLNDNPPIANEYDSNALVPTATIIDFCLASVNYALVLNYDSDRFTTGIVNITGDCVIDPNSYANNLGTTRTALFDDNIIGTCAQDMSALPATNPTPVNPPPYVNGLFQEIVTDFCETSSFTEDSPYDANALVPYGTIVNSCLSTNPPEVIVYDPNSLIGLDVITGDCAMVFAKPVFYVANNIPNNLIPITGDCLQNQPIGSNVGTSRPGLFDETITGSCAQNLS